MANLAVADRRAYYLCPRCGTVSVQVLLEVDDDDPPPAPVVYVPELVGRCRVFMQTMPPATGQAEWVRLGIAEAVLPGE